MPFDLKFHMQPCKKNPCEIAHCSFYLITYRGIGKGGSRETSPFKLMILFVHQSF